MKFKGYHHLLQAYYQLPKSTSFKSNLSNDHYQSMEYLAAVIRQISHSTNQAQQALMIADDCPSTNDYYAYVQELLKFLITRERLTAITDKMQSDIINFQWTDDIATDVKQLNVLLQTQLKMLKNQPVNAESQKLIQHYEDVLQSYDVKRWMQQYYLNAAGVQSFNEQIAITIYNFSNVNPNRFKIKDRIQASENAQTVLDWLFIWACFLDTSESNGCAKLVLTASFAHAIYQYTSILGNINAKTKHFKSLVNANNQLYHEPQIAYHRLQTLHQTAAMDDWVRLANTETMNHDITMHTNQNLNLNHKYDFKMTYIDYLRTVNQHQSQYALIINQKFEPVYYHIFYHDPIDADEYMQIPVLIGNDPF